MKSCLGVMIVLSVMATLCQGAAEPAKDHSMLSMRINPALKDVASDKKFFGPPFPADYPDDKRPQIKKSIMDSIRSKDQPYPALQSREDFDRDFVKDENSDTGMWKAQFEYDAARKRLMDEEYDDKTAQADADKAAHDEADAQRGADDASKKASDAQKGVDDAKAGQDADDHDDDDEQVHDDGHETLEELKRKVKEAEDAYEKQKKAFEQCERELKEAKDKFEKLKAELAEMEKKAYSTAKLWAEQKTIRMNALKAKKDAEKTAAAAKTKAARELFAKAQAKKAAADKKLAQEKREHEQALRTLEIEKADIEKANNGLENARIRLEKLRGIAPPAAHKSGAPMTTMISLLLLGVARCFV